MASITIVAKARKSARKAVTLAAPAAPVAPAPKKQVVYKLYNTQNGLEVVISPETGECFASQRALARMCQVAEATIRAWVNTESIQTKPGVIQTAGGVQSAALLNEGAICQALAKYNPAFLMRCAKEGGYVQYS